MSWREYQLAKQGFDLLQKALDRRGKENTALLLTALTGTPVTAAQLLGEEVMVEDTKTREKEANRAIKAAQRKRKKLGLAPTGLIPVAATGQAFDGNL